MATFDGVNIFGPAPTFTHDARPNAAQVTHYPGVRGVERLELGPRETMSTVTGVLVGETVDDLGAAFVEVRAYKNDATRAELIDTDGITWADAILISIRTYGRSTYAAGWGWCRNYEMVFFHCNAPPSGGAGDGDGTEAGP